MCSWSEAVGNDSKHWPDRAIKTRFLTDGIKDPIMSDLADDYDKLPDRGASPSSSPKQSHQQSCSRFGTSVTDGSGVGLSAEVRS
jgi:hypothetical protein